MSNRIYNEINRMKYNMKVIEQYNNFSLMGANDEIKYLKERIDKLLDIKDTQELIEEFKWCAKVSNMFYNEVDNDFKNHCLQEERARIE